MPEVIESQAIVVRDETALEIERQRFMPVMPTEVALSRRAAIVDAFGKLMKEGEDYGKIPGAGNKPTLMQPGAQKLDNLFGLVPRFTIDEREEDWLGAAHGGEPFFRYLVRCQLFRATNAGEFVMGEALGECNSWESKYRWRTAERTCPNCGVGAIIQTKHKSGNETGKPKNFWCAPFKGGCNAGFKLDDQAIIGQETGRKANPEIFDQVNTLLKMAQKRAHVAATINATSASEFFTQDLEDARSVQEDAPPVAAASAPQTRSGARSTPEARQEPFDKFKMRDQFQGLKTDMKKLTGNDDDYYAVLGSHGCEHSTDLQTKEQAAPIYRELKQRFEDLYTKRTIAQDNDPTEPF
ncbi:MAG TPA: hypothetical protein VJQ59_16850 [Candidatus Sulfotelmatobacter sp.]|nr:hypothetical protein [Candidatus Sulfotelmatobacter sp.]